MAFVKIAQQAFIAQEVGLGKKNAQPMQHAHQVHLNAILDISQMKQILDAMQIHHSLQHALPANIMVVHMAVVKIAQQAFIAQEVCIVHLQGMEK